jgi:DNA-binding MarR family transcriptional regulator
MPTSDVLSRFIVETLRLSGALAMNADEMVADIGLSFARWQVVGAIHDAPVPQPVAHIARDMRLSRQGVQRIVNDLHSDGLVEFLPNPHHARAQLVVLTDRGAAAFRTAIGRQDQWMKSFDQSLDDLRLQDATRTMIAIREHVENAHRHSRPPAKDRDDVHEHQKHI